MKIGLAVFPIPLAAVRVRYPRTADSLEPISKSSEQDNEAGELDEAEEVLWIKLPTHEDSALPLDPCEEALDEPTPQEATQAASVLGRLFLSVRAVRRNHLYAILP